MFGLLLRRVGLDLDWRVEAEGGGGLRMLTTQTEQEGAKTTGRTSGKSKGATMATTRKGIRWGAKVGEEGLQVLGKKGRHLRNGELAKKGPFHDSILVS